MDPDPNQMNTDPQHRLLMFFVCAVAASPSIEDMMKGVPPNVTVKPMSEPLGKFFPILGKKTVPIRYNVKTRCLTHFFAARITPIQLLPYLGTFRAPKYTFSTRKLNF